MSELQQSVPNSGKRGHRWFWVALLNFVLAAVAGILLRYAFVQELEWMQYRHFQHAHSHVAMLGWIFLGIYALALELFLPLERRSASLYKWLFLTVQVTVVGMLIAFALQGYAFWSILFSTLHVVASYVFVLRLWRDLNRSYPFPTWSVRWLKLALLLMVLSTVALWLLPAILVLIPAKGTWYYMAIQFYLHFQLNGWFLFSVFALFFRWSEIRGIRFDATDMRRFFWLLLGSTLPTYALALRWANPLEWLFYINGVGVLIQLAALLVFWKFLRPQLSQLRGALSKWGRILMGVTLICFSAKVLIQSALVVPYVAEAAYTIRNYVIGFIHLITLGILAHFLLALANEKGYFRAGSYLALWGFRLFISGFVLSEMILFLQGSMFWAHLGFLPGYHPLLVVVSSLLLLGATLLLLDGGKETGNKALPTP